MNREKLGMVGLASVLVFGAGFAGRKYLNRPPELKFEPNPTPIVTTPRPSDATRIIIHIAGAVKSPGVYTLTNGQRVNEALDKAGGPLPEADLEQLNLAAKALDATMLYVPKKQEPVKPATEASYLGKSGKSSYLSKPIAESRGTKAKGSGVVNLNTASASELESIPGIGPSTAQKILDYRNEHGGFGSIDELRAVKGIGAKKLEKMRKFLRL